MNVCLGNINGGKLRVEFVQSLWAARVGNPPVARTHLLHTWGPYLDDARNTVVDAFLSQTDDDILLFADSDTGFTAEQVSELTNMIGPSSPCVGGLYYSAFGRDGIGFAPVAYKWGSHPETQQRFLRQLDPDIERLDECRPGEMIKVDAVGTGFMAIHRDLLIRMGEQYAGTQPWFAEEDFENTHHGEDFTFCLRLAEMGVPVYLAPHVRVKHYKICAI